MAECEAQNLPFTVQQPTGPGDPAALPGADGAAGAAEQFEPADSLMRAGKLYLTVQDAIALAIENNLDLEIDRYGPLLAESALERAEAGGPIRGVPSASAQVSSVNAGVGVNGSTQSAGLGGGGGGGGGGRAAARRFSRWARSRRISTRFCKAPPPQAHLTQPQANTVLSQTTALIQSVHTTIRRCRRGC